MALSLLVGHDSVQAAKPIQPQEDITVNDERMATVQVFTDQGRFEYHLDNSGKSDVAVALQAVFDRTAALEDSSATFVFLPGVYYLNAPIKVKLVCLKLQGTGHGGLDVHGMNLKSGTIFQLGEDTGPNCISFLRAKHSRSFPSGESPWPNHNCKVEVEGMTFLGHNNTGVDTASGYSRFRGDKPNFRGLHWYPAEGRYEDVERDGQRALVFPQGPGKNEMLRVNSCVFTDLYVGIEASDCDVSFITDSWFAQMVYGIRIRGSAPVCMVKNNCFADLETGVILGNAKASNLNGNGFAYVSKCFEVTRIAHSTINNNVVDGWNQSTGAAARGAFCHVGASENLVMTGNSVNWDLDSRARTRTVDEKPNGRALINIENSSKLLFANNVVDTSQTQTVVRLHNVNNSVITDNIVTFANGGNAVALTGSSQNNFFRRADPADSDPFDEYIP